MNIESLAEKKKEIRQLEKEIKALKKKRERLERLEVEYYHEYFDTPRDEFALLTDIPSNQTNKKQVLYDYSVLNIDTIGKIICKLIKKYENKDYVSRRLIRYEQWQNAFELYPVELPILVIGQEDEVKKLDKNKENIIISYDDHKLLTEYPTKTPVTWKTSRYGGYYDRSNYGNLLNYFDGLSFEHPTNQDYIDELIYSLAYYQRENGIIQMNPRDTWNVYRKIYKK